MTTWNNIFFQFPSSFMMEIISTMHDYVSMFLFSILILIFFNLLYTFFLKSFNLEFFEHHQMESVWTIIPFFILVFILFPSLSSLYMLDSCLFCGMTISIMGHQWYWSYYYKDLKEYFFDSYMDSSSSPYFVRLLDVDNRLLIPTFLPIRFLVSSSDVIHSWSIPSFGLKMDAIPGRINQFCFSSKRSGIFFGQCSEICGSNHSFMPIVVESVSFNKFIRFF